MFVTAGVQQHHAAQLARHLHRHPGDRDSAGTDRHLRGAAHAAGRWAKSQGRAPKTTGHTLTRPHADETQRHLDIRYTSILFLYLCQSYHNYLQLSKLFWTAVQTASLPSQI